MQSRIHLAQFKANDQASVFLPGTQTVWPSLYLMPLSGKLIIKAYPSAYHFSHKKYN